ncbi:malonyl CoA-acyl carrier protein transacylase [Alicyclobacillus hesperidum]|uniref:Malonyl CoA-acyl carrier protein transacylase n=1 Tax=Alicyclobacillus hesperidum TaxID=89784 RepID=A0A1H2UUZ3_9BACL|nr:ACP S-malonyltransferase [Alicyclobacillus hesperidum]GLV14630.1 malonyl CoA-acyl carrier protein transacylase [Alicyclobacillus hesperidum]SDW59876.1 [Acyl-carrier-protein] S-malonyltransferase [Alicyclobacillus hesperidum]
MNVAYVFPGQGAQYVGMGQALIDHYPVARAVFEEADDVLNMNLTKLILSGPDDELKLTYNTQPALLTMSVAVLRVLAERVDIQPVAVAGHSLGEYSALVAADAISFQDAVRLVYQRGRMMDEALPAGHGTMSAVLGLDEESLAAACSQAAEETGEVVELANVNCPGQIVISGTTAAIARASELAKASGAKRVLPLAVSGPFHCSLMRPAADALGELLDSTEIHDAKVPVVANVDGHPRTTAADLREALKRQLYTPVRWWDGVLAMRRLGVDIVIELGPGTVLSGLVRKIDKSLETLHAEDPATLDAVCTRMTSGGEEA